MPYIPENERPDINYAISHLPLHQMSEGQLNYAISSMLDEWLLIHGLSYRSLNAAIGILECAKMEIYRRLSFYEDGKLKTNGEVFCNVPGPEIEISDK